jgi:4-hydroxybenzoate polyprenyltransferase
LGWSIAKALGLDYPFLFLSLFFYCSLGMHLLVGFLNTDSARYNDPDRAGFCLKYYRPLKAMGAACFILSLSSAWLIGRNMFLLSLFQTSLGFIYAIPLTPVKKLASMGIRGFKDIPGAKILGASGGWALCISSVAFLSDPPLLAISLENLTKGAFGFVLVFIQVFARSFFMDIQDARGDRAFGLISPSHFLGPKKSNWALGGLLVLWTILLLAGYFSNILNSLALLLILTGPVFCALVLRRYYKTHWLGGFQFDLLLDGQFLLSGAAGLAYACFIAG